MSTPPPTPAQQLEQIQRLVADRFSIEPAQIIKRGRRPEVADARSAFYLIARGLGKMSTVLIGKCLGGRDHSTVVFGSKRGAALYATEQEFKARVDWVRENLK